VIDDLVDVAMGDLERDLRAQRVATVARVGDDLLVRPLVGSLPEMKTLGATWDRPRMCWKLPASLMHLRSVEGLLGSVELENLEALDFIPVGPSVDDPRLFEFQREGAARLVAAPRGQLLCASPGLGKTAIAIAAADKVVTDDQIVVVAPAKLLKTWSREIAKWCEGDASVAIIHGGEPDWEVVQAARWLVTSWDMVAIHQDWFKGNWPLWILDESVLAKSRRSTRSMALRGGTRRSRKVRADGTLPDPKRWDNLRKSIGRVWLLSGSPTTRHADDLWAQLNLIWPRAFPSYWRFAERYCVVEETVWARTVIGDRRDHDPVADNLDLIYVINQESVLELPEYLFEAIDVDLTPKQATAYEDMERDFLAELDSGDILVADNRMAQLVRLQQITSFWEGASAKHDALVELITSGTYEGPHLVWTHWREGAQALTKRLEDAGLRVGHVYGGMGAKISDALIEDYKAGRTEVLVLSLGVGKFGHTLTNTATVHWIDKTWNGDDYFQGLRRVRRIGLGHRPVSVTYRAPGTVDELVELNLEGKVAGISRVTNANLKELILGLGR
jgi:SNF2 family DNA or RNA helicase